jgi:hypothetical protein
MIAMSDREAVNESFETIFDDKPIEMENNRVHKKRRTSKALQSMVFHRLTLKNTDIMKILNYYQFVMNIQIKGIQETDALWIQSSKSLLKRSS